MVTFNFFEALKLSKDFMKIGTLAFLTLEIMGDLTNFDLHVFSSMSMKHPA